MCGAITSVVRLLDLIRHPRVVRRLCVNKLKCTVCTEFNLSIKFVGESTLAINGYVELTPFARATSATTPTMISTARAVAIEETARRSL